MSNRNIHIIYPIVLFDFAIKLNYGLGMSVVMGDRLCYLAIP